MEVETQHSFDWAHDAYVALNDPNVKQQQQQQHDNWATFGSGPTFTIPPSLLTHASVERYGQVTPPEELSPAEPKLDPIRESSIPVEELRNETIWPGRHSNGSQQQPTYAQSSPAEEPTPKRRRTSKHAAANQSGPTPQQDANNDANPQPPRRKRGRPKSQPQMVEAFTADGFPFQVSSARQSHLEKNRVAAHKCRQRKKEYINGLEGRAREFSSKNKALEENVAMLREEVLSLKNEVLRHAGCGFWAVDEYLARCAGDLLRMEAPPTLRSPSMSTQGPNISTSQPQESSVASLDSSPDMEDFGGLELLRDFGDADMDEMEQQ